MLRCLDSILAQSYTDFEVLLIDDGSTDGSGKICDRYGQKDARICVFHKENGGLSDARNFALDRSSGEYITFIDSDDYVGRDYLKVLYEMVMDNQADISAITMYDVHTIETLFVDSVDERVEFDCKCAYREMLSGKYNLGVMVCGKLYVRELFEDVRFPVGQPYEDLAVTPLLMSQCRKCVKSTYLSYYYYQRPDSLSNGISIGHINAWIYTIEQLLVRTKEYYPELYPYAETRLVRTTMWWIIDRSLNCSFYYEQSIRIRRKWKGHFIRSAVLPGLTLKERLKATLFLVNLHSYRRIRLRMIS